LGGQANKASHEAEDYFISTVTTNFHKTWHQYFALVKYCWGKVYMHLNIGLAAARLVATAVLGWLVYFDYCCLFSLNLCIFLGQVKKLYA